ncbi:hypothetical protein G6F55_007640 [Rhizopus delemar]|uniref:Glycoside hydrolase family 31 N-terminal domain-containing protein n=2 Tax=Rhizopus TaxID=4842 RepID=A0A9P6YYJ0_9FUNG|nr:hypothetical protein G6F55_007640 [Rhizopus delemar]KAG1544478.1 hypothetical protein G6F51_006033 [Rhizopus arrhizus]KAG1521456.1 hypothetical protein G6F52_006731 [Rhizopus delemar]KAG1549198.1 hypothetical protein G6F49_009672 [Rhizopus delemar]KAG1567036.1 hypothetical protein G6F50_008578 [Rhizopus delemar]
MRHDGHSITITFVTDSIVRVQYLTASEAAKQTKNEIISSMVKGITVNSVNSRLDDGSESSSLEFQTASIRLVVTILPAFQLKWYSAKETDDYLASAFAEDLMYRSYAFDKSTSDKWHYQRKYEGSLYYGLGERTGSFNLSGRSFVLERLDCMGYDAETQDPLYKFCPFYTCLSRETKRAYGVYYNNFSKAKINFGQELDAMWKPYVYYNSESGPVDYYMIFGPEVSSVVQGYSLITGRPRHLPPRYSFGYLASSMSYTEAENAQERIKKFVENCKTHQIPCDGIHLSSGYTVNDKGDRCVFTWNHSRFPNPEELAKTLKDSGIRIFANVKPWLLKDIHPDFNQVKQEGGFIWDTENNKPSEVMQWRGGRNTMGAASYIDFSSKAGYDYWKSRIKSELLSKGFLLWLDNNEFTVADDGHTYACQIPPYSFLKLLKPKGNPNSYVYGPTIPSKKSTIKEVGTPLQTLLMIQASYEALQDHDPLQRPFLITRSATPYSNQLVTQTWSGDNTTCWNTVKYNIPMGLGASLCGMPAGYGHDVGGFAGPHPDPEMLVRWVQQGIFWPRFCVHSWNTGDIITELWMFPDMLPIIRSSLQFRYRMIPYLYTLYVHYVYYRSQPLIRPLLYDHQHDVNTYEQQFEFMLGPSLLVAPVYQPGENSRRLYLPSNSAWYHYQTGKYYKTTEDAGQWIEVPAELKDEAAPIFVKEGSLICFGKAMMNVHESPDDDRRVQIFPERFDGMATADREYTRKTLVLYEDDGDTLYHETGNAYAEIHVWMEESETEIHVGLEIVKDGYFPYYNTVWVTCPIASETRKLIFEVPDEESNLVEKQPSRKLPRFVDDKDNCVYFGLKLRNNINMPK